MSEKIKGYRPLSQESTDRITKAWEWYRAEIGLEGMITFDMRKADREARKAAIASHRRKRSELIELFQEVKREIGIGSNKQPEVEVNNKQDRR